MTFDNYLEVQAISRFAAEMEPATRHEFLKRACDGNHRLLKQVEAQLDLWNKTQFDFAQKQKGRAQRFLGRHRLKLTAAIIALIFAAWVFVTLWQAHFLDAFLNS